MKQNWEIETYWSFSTPLTMRVPSWKHVPLDLYLAEYIVTLRIRDYMIKDKDYRIHSTMIDNGSVIMEA
jgi:hypothetical protein